MSPAKKALIFLDRVLNKFPFMGKDWETISTRSYDAKIKGKRWGRIAVAVIDWIWKRVFHVTDHCMHSYLWERKL